MVQAKELRLSGLELVKGHRLELYPRPGDIYTSIRCTCGRLERSINPPNANEKIKDHYFKHIQQVRDAMTKEAK